jgi:hypothetical protein
VTVNPLTEATDGSALVKVHAPFEVDVGKINSTLDTLSIDKVMSLNVPRTGLGAVTVNFIVADAANQFVVGAWSARIVTEPPSNKVTLFPETVAILESKEVNDQLPSELLVGGTIVKFPCERETLWSVNAPIVGIPGVTVNREDLEAALNAPDAA